MWGNICYGWRLVKVLAKRTLDNFFLVLVVAGVLFFFFSFFLDQQNKYKEFFLALSSVVLVSGVLSAFTRWLDAYGIINRTINDILFGREYIAKPDNFRKVWKRLLDSAIDEHMPKIKPYIPDDFLQKPIPSAGELFYSSYTQRLEVEWESMEDRTVMLYETLECTIETVDSSLHTLPYQYEKNAPEDFNFIHDIETLTVDGKSYSSKNFVTKDSESNPDGTKKHTLVYEIPLEGKDQYHYFRRSKRNFSLDFEPYTNIMLGRHTLTPTVEVKCRSPELIAFFETNGTFEDFSEIEGKNPGQEMVRTFKGLMLIAQGYVVFFTCKA